MYRELDESQFLAEFERIHDQWDILFSEGPTRRSLVRAIRRSDGVRVHNIWWDPSIRRYVIEE